MVLGVNVLPLGFVVDEVVPQLDDKLNTLGGVPARM